MFGCGGQSEIDLYMSHFWFRATTDQLYLISTSRISHITASEKYRKQLRNHFRLLSLDARQILYLEEFIARQGNISNKLLQQKVEVQLRFLTNKLNITIPSAPAN